MLATKFEHTLHVLQGSWSPVAQQVMHPSCACSGQDTLKPLQRILPTSDVCIMQKHPKLPSLNRPNVQHAAAEHARIYSFTHARFAKTLSLRSSIVCTRGQSECSPQHCMIGVKLVSPDCSLVALPTSS
jgi:hypothetical protein